MHNRANSSGGFSWHQGPELDVINIRQLRSLTSSKSPWHPSIDVKHKTRWIGWCRQCKCFLSILLGHKSKRAQLPPRINNLCLFFFLVSSSSNNSKPSSWNKPGNKMTTSVLHLPTTPVDLAGPKSVPSSQQTQTANVKPGLPSPSTSETSDYQRSTPSPGNEDQFRALSMNSFKMHFLTYFETKK